MARMRYDEVENLSETELRKVYEDEIIEELVKGYFKKRRYQIGKENLIRDDSKKYQRLIGIYSRLAQNEKDAKKRICYGNMCRIIESVKSQYRTGSGC